MVEDPRGPIAGAFVLGVLMLVALYVWMRPTVEPLPAPPPEMVATQPAPRRPRPYNPVEVTTEDPELQDFNLGPSRTRQERTPMPEDHSYSANLEGLAGAALDRGADAANCFRKDWEDGKIVGTMVVRMTVHAGDEGGEPELMVTNSEEHLPQAEACLNGLFAHTHFASPEGESAMMWPIILPEDSWREEEETTW
jgi:hypothetical protein